MPLTDTKIPIDIVDVPHYRKAMLHIHLFGPLRLEYNDAPYRFAALPKTLPLFAYLLLHRTAPLPRSTVAFTLWPDLDEESARSNLRRHLYELRRALPPASNDLPWVNVDSTTVQWNPAAPCWLDVAAFEDACHTPDKLAEVIELYQGDLLPTVDEDWLIFARERLRTAFLTALAQLIEQRRSASDYVGAIDAAATLLRHEPLREDIVRTLMTLRADSGDLPGALLEYRRFEQELRRELDAPPTAETSAHYDALARRAVTQDALRPPAEPAPAGGAPLVNAIVTPMPRHNLPAQLTSFVGRGQELADIRVLLGRSQAPVRLLTLVGPGGSGKTRLALEAAVRVLEEDIFPDGVFFAPLAALTDPGEVVGALSVALNVAEQGSSALKDRLLAHLQTRRLLLVLDNFEHVDAAAPLVAELLATAPGLACLVTSRVALRIYGEQEYPVAPLPLPDLDDLPAYERLAHIPSVELFIIRSRAVNPTYMLRPEDAATIAEICVRLDGLPLAIELAAARSKLYSPAALLARLSNRLAFLENRARDAEQRHQTLRATLDWSYRLMGAAEQKLLARLAVFARSFTAEAAETVCGDAAFDVLDALGALCDHSLLQPTQTEHGVRFIMLTTVHEYADHLLDPAERAALLQRHAAYYDAFAQQAGRQIYGAQQMVWIAALREEEDNLRVALRWSFTAGVDAVRAQCGMRIARGLARFWQISGRVTEGRSWFEQAVTMLDAVPTAEQVEVLGQAGLFAQLQGDHTAALEFHERALTLARTTGDAALLASALYTLGSTYGRAGDAPRAADFLDQCLTLRRQLAPGAVTDAQMALTLNNLAVAYVNSGRLEEAEALYTESLAIKRRNHDQFGIASTLVNLGDLALRRGDYDRSAQLTQESLQLRVALDDQLGIARVLDHTAELATLRREHERAATLFAAATAAFARLHARRNAHVAIEVEAYLASIQENLTPESYQRAVQIGERMTLDEAVRFALSII